MEFRVYWQSSRPASPGATLIWGVRLEVWNLVFGVWLFWVNVLGLGFGLWCLEFGISGLGFVVWGLGFEGVRFRIE